MLYIELEEKALWLAKAIRHYSKEMLANSFQPKVTVIKDKERNIPIIKVNMHNKERFKIEVIAVTFVKKIEDKPKDVEVAVYEVNCCYPKYNNRFVDDETNTTAIVVDILSTLIRICSDWF